MKNPSKLLNDCSAGQKELAMLKILSVLISISLSTAANAQTENPSKEKVLRVIQNGLRTCSSVTSVQRNDSIYRINTTMSSSSEFDLDDMNSIASSSILTIKCEAMACVTNKSEFSGVSKDRPPSNEVILMCTGAATQLNEAIKYYRKNF